MGTSLAWARWDPRSLDLSTDRVRGKRFFLPRFGCPRTTERAPNKEVVMRCRRSSQVAFALTLLAVAPYAQAACTTTQDSGLVRRSLNQGMHCADKRLRSGPTATCNVTTPPAC